jgi:hypothetical protein
MDERSGPCTVGLCTFIIGGIQERFGVMKGCPHTGALPESEGDEERSQRVLIRWKVVVMKSRFPWVLLIGLGLVGAAVGETGRIGLPDGSIISGEVVGFADGRYPIESPALGRVSIDQSQIRSLQPGGAAGGGASESWVRRADQRSLAAPDWLQPQTGVIRSVLTAIDSPADAIVG